MDLHAAYGLAARLRKDPNQPLLFPALEQYLGNLCGGLQTLEAEHDEMQQQFAHLQARTNHLQQEVDRRKMFKIRIIKK